MKILKFLKSLIYKKDSNNCIHNNVKAKENKYGYFKVKCLDCGKTWIDG